MAEKVVSISSHHAIQVRPSQAATYSCLFPNLYIILELWVGQENVKGLMVGEEIC